MTKEEIEEIKSIFSLVLDERRSIDSETHRKDHEFLHILMKKEERKSELMESTKKQIFGWAMITTIGFIGYSILHNIKIFLQKVVY